MSKQLKLTNKHKKRLNEQLNEFAWEVPMIGDKVDVYRKCKCKSKRCDNGACQEPVCRSVIVEIGIGSRGIQYTLKNGTVALANEMELVSDCTPKRLQKLVRNIVREAYNAPVKGVCK